jgi:N-acetylglucosaminyldiphosphoundecaprenol N-acetyl-beta-D-mannosaminyltransferase
MVHVAMYPRVNTTSLDGLAFARLDEAGTCDYVVHALEARHGGTLLTLNTDRLRRARLDELYRSLCDRATLIVADGMPIVWASKLRGQALPDRVAGVDLVMALARSAALEGRSVYLLGGPPGTAQRTAIRLSSLYGGLKVAGTRCPPMGFEHDNGYVDDLRRELIDVNPDIVFVALGIGKEEMLMEQLRGSLPSTWWVTVGATFSFLSGDLARAPHWMRHAGLEWAHRLVHQPHLAKRYAADVPYGIGLLARAAVRRLQARRQR